MPYSFTLDIGHLVAGDYIVVSFAATASFAVTPALSPDADGDGVLAGTDNCPTIANPAQTNTDAALNAAGATIGGAPLPADSLGDACDPDDDNDTWSDAAEGTIGTDALDNCRDKASDNAWPADIDNDGLVQIADMALVANDFGDGVPPSGSASPRHNVDPDPPDTAIQISDMARIAGFFGDSCT